MEYIIGEMSKMSGVSVRTLRYYDQIKLLKPSRINESGYRVYSSKEVDTLQQILFYREIGLCLEDIKKIIFDSKIDINKSLESHLILLNERKKNIEILIENVNKTIRNLKGVEKMTDKEKFEGFKQNMIDNNEKQYGKEIREKYGVEKVEKSNQIIKSKTEEEFKEIEQLANEINKNLKIAFEIGDPNSEIAQTACKLHKQWLTFYWKDYSKEAHIGIANTYVQDERFKEYYDKIAPGCAEFLRDAIIIYCSK